MIAVMCLGALLPALAIEHGAPGKPHAQPLIHVHYYTCLVITAEVPRILVDIHACNGARSMPLYPYCASESVILLPPAAALRPDTGSEASTWTSDQASELTQSRMYSKRQVPIEYPADQGSSLASTDSGSGSGGWEASSWSSVDVALETRSRMYYLHGQQAVGPVEVSGNDQGSAVASTDDGAPAPGTLYYHGYNKPQEGSAVASAGGQGISLENSAVASTDDAAPAPGTLYYHGYSKPQEGSAVASAEDDAAPAPGTLYYHGYNKPQEGSAVASAEDDAAPAPGTLYYHGYSKPQEGSAVASAEDDAAPAPGTLYYHGYNKPQEGSGSSVPSWYTGGRRLLEVVTQEAERVLDFLNLPWAQA